MRVGVIIRRVRVSGFVLFLSLSFVFGVSARVRVKRLKGLKDSKGGGFEG